MAQVLKDEVANITGAGRGLGKAFAQRFAEEGAKLLLPDISLERAESVAKEIRAAGGQAVAMETDVSDEMAAKMMAEKVMQVYGRADILINNAAVYYGLHHKPWDTNSVEEWDRIFAVNVKGTWLCCKAIAPLMIKQKRGKIINLCSSIIKSPDTHLLLPYALSKAAIRSMTEALARALGPSGINVNAIAPGFTNTEASSTTIEDINALFSVVIQTQSIRRREEPQDLLGTAVFLASKESAFIAGQVIFVDGGT
jgi:NAD(P)-dependent dehydrogenase (short-subunit alcohol dehydrogenase family)